MDYHAVTRPTGSGAGERKVFDGFCDQAIGPARLLFVPSSLRPCFGAPAPKA